MPHPIKAQKLRSTGSTNNIVLIPRIPIISKDTEGTFVSFKRTQFLVLLAYYLTLNRAQGQSLKRAGLYLPTSVFSHEYVHMRFSQCRDPDKVFVYANQKEFDNIRHLLEDGKTYTRNVVYDKIFSYNRGTN